MSERDGGIGTRSERMQPAEHTQTPYFPAGNGRSVADLLRELSAETVDLMQQEMALAKAEMRGKLEVYQRSTISMGIGGALLMAALLTALWALNLGLTSLLAQGMDLDVAVWLSPLILTGVLGAIGWGMVKTAKERMADEGLAPRRTAATLREDSRWAKEKVQEIKEEITHGR